MALLLKNGAVFLHIPKTGGNWVARVLGELDLVERSIDHKHTDINRLGYKPPYIFCFVRHPLTWYESWFRYQTNLEWQVFNGGWHPCKALNDLGASEFAEFINNVLEDVPGFVSRLYARYTAHADFIGKQENLVNDLIEVLNINNFGFSEQFIRDHNRVNVSPELQVEWPIELKQDVLSAEREAIIRYGYASSPGR